MTEEKKILKELLLGFYQDNITQCRHHESQRATVTSSIIAIDTIIIGLITFDKVINSFDVPLCFLLTFLSLFGSAFTFKHFERYSLAMDRARQYRLKLDEEFGEGEVLRLKLIADQIHRSKFRKIRKFRLHYFWIFLHVLITIIGLVLTTVAIFFPIHFV